MNYDTVREYHIQLSENLDKMISFFGKNNLLELDQKKLLTDLQLLKNSNQ